MSGQKNYSIVLIGTCILFVVGSPLYSSLHSRGKSSPAMDRRTRTFPFDQIKAARMAVKAARAKEHLEMLNSRYSLAKKTSAEVFMSGGKPIPVGPTANLRGVTWEQLNTMPPEQIKEKGVFPIRALTVC